MNINNKLNLIVEGKNVDIYAGSCHNPSVEDADIYVSLDVEQPVYDWEKPWGEKNNKKHVRFPIEDMFIPMDVNEFKKLINYLKSELHNDKAIHVGCIGGKGRTGIVLAALTELCMGEKLIDLKGDKISAIDYVRKNYNIKAVETVPQVLFLHHNFNIKIPNRDIKEINKFNKIFKEEIGVYMEDILKRGASFEEIIPTIREIDNFIYQQMNFSREVVSKDDFINPKFK